MDKIKSTFIVKHAGPPEYYLGSDYIRNDQHKTWVIGSKTYVTEAVRRLEGLHGTLAKQNTPLPPDCHPELDKTPLLNEDGIRTYQMLIGMAQWATLIGRLDITFAVASLSRFNANPREGHLKLSFQIFGYLKKFPNKSILIDSEPLALDPELVEFEADFLEEYPDVQLEEEDPIFPEKRGKALTTAIFFDANHGHDVETRRSISGLITFVGSTPVDWSSRRQGCIATSTYCAEFMAMRAATEEAVALRYMLRSLGVPLDGPTKLFGDNLGVIQSASIPDANLKKKHVALSYHCVREAVAAGVIAPFWVNTHENFADIMTKQIGRTAFIQHVHDLML